MLKDDRIFGEKTRKAFENLTALKRNELEDSFVTFYSNSLDYLNMWLAPLDEFKANELNWLLLDECPKLNDISKCYKKFCSSIDEDEEIDCLIDELVQLEDVYLKLIKTNFVKMEIAEKWSTILKNKNLKHIRKLVCILLSIGPSNAFCESIFSKVSALWTDEKNRFKPNTVNAIIACKENAEFNCSQSFQLFMSNPELLKMAKSNSKY